MKKRLLVGLLTSVIAIGLLSGCGNASKKEAKTLVLWTNMQVEVEALQELATEWGDKEGYKVEVIHQSPSVQKFAQAVNSPDGPDGVLGIPNDQLADYVNAGMVAEVPSDLYKDEDYSSAAIQASYVDGKRYAVPLAVETISLFYNADKVKEAPKTWEELVKVAKNLGGIQFDATSIYYDLGFVRACGGYIFKYEAGKYDVKDIGLNNKGAKEAYAFIQDLCKKYDYVSADVTADIARSNFQNGNTAFYIGGPWDMDGFQNAGLNYKVAKMPTFKGNTFVTPVGTQIAFVSNVSDNQEAVWKCFQYIAENGGEKLFVSGKRIPAKLTEQQKDAVVKDENIQALVAQINDGEPMPTVSELGQLWGIHMNNIRSMWSGEMNPEETADNIAKQLKEAVDLMNSGK